MVHDVYGEKVIPENLGDYEPTASNNNPPRTPADIIHNAQVNLAVTQGVASFFFDPSNPLTDLQQIVTGIKGLGYTFVSTVWQSAEPGPAGRPVTASAGRPPLHRRGEEYAHEVSRGGGHGLCLPGRACSSAGPCVHGCASTRRVTSLPSGHAASSRIRRRGRCRGRCTG